MYSDVRYSLTIGFVGAILFLLVDKYEPEGPVSFIQRQHFEPNQPTSECLQVARQRCLDRAHNDPLVIASFCGSDLQRNAP